MKKRLVFTTFLALVAAFALLIPAGETAAHGPPPEERPVYLALGDSLAFGIGASDPATTGYVPLFYDDLRSPAEPGEDDSDDGDSGPDAFGSKFLMLENLAVGGPAAPPGGETTTTMIAGGQLDAALAELTARNSNPRHADDVRVVTLDIGGNDMFAVVPLCLAGPSPACTSAIRTAFGTFSGNFDHILDELTAAAGPKTTMIVMTYYNPLVNPFCPLSPQAALADALLEGSPAMGLPDGLNDLIRVNAASHGVAVADVFGLLGPSDVQPDCRHASDSGYRIMADEFIAAGPGGPPSPVTFTHSVASGDVTPGSAVLWTRVDQLAKLTVEVSTDPAFPPGATLKKKVKTSSQGDFTARVLVGIKPARTYYYRWRHGSSMSDVGTFKTPPLPETAADLKFAFSGDSDGTNIGGAPFFNNFEALDAARLEGLDFFLYLGDTIYSDSVVRPFAGLSPAESLAEYRHAYRVNRDVQALRDLLAATSTYAIWDDHEVHNDFDGATVDPARYANGREVFLEYMPVDARTLPSDPSCAGDPLFRVFHWGSDADVIVLDERSCRSADVTAACLVQLAPGVFRPDLAPGMPVPLRTAFNAQLPPELKPILQPSPPAGCLDAINDPSRTMLGPVQKELLKAALLDSDATFKFIVNEVPIQQFFALPYDRWEGYGAERTEILDFIHDNGVENVVFLTTDTHANFINEVSTNILSPLAPVVAKEFVTGPIATNTFETEIRAFFGGGALGELGVSAFQQILSAVGTNCRNLDAYSYGVVEVDSSAGTATVTLKDDSGAVLTDQLNPAVSCREMIGP